MPRDEERPSEPVDEIHRLEVSVGPEPTPEVLRVANSARMYFRTAGEPEVGPLSSGVEVLKLRRGP
jgi:hypothetical protein